MSKQEIKQKIREAVEQSDFKDEIQKVSLFGSYLHGDFNPESDVDVLIEFTPTACIGFFSLARIQSDIKQTVKKEIDLLTPGAISKYFREEVLAEAETVYEK